MTRVVFTLLSFATPRRTALGGARQAPRNASTMSASRSSSFEGGVVDRAAAIDEPRGKRGGSGRRRIGEQPVVFAPDVRVTLARRGLEPLPVDHGDVSAFVADELGLF